jgi:signal transduction histidine kinase/ActR/RegA family two-component response regulator
MAEFLHTGLSGDGDVRAQLRSFDWGTSPLGDPSGWPAPLATAVSMVLSSAFPMFVAWGPELSFLYNDAYAHILGDKHPRALGQPFQQVWYEIWPDILPIVDGALSNKSSYFEDLPLTMLRKGYAEQTWFTFSYSPLHDSDGRVAGMFCTCVETTGRVLGERRAGFELELSDALRPLTSAEEVVATSSALLGRELNLGRVLYAECDEAGAAFFVPRDWTAGVLPSLAGNRFRLDAFGPAVGASLRGGEVLAVGDIDADPRTADSRDAYGPTGVRAFVAVPLVKGGQLVALLCLNRAEPYHWTEAEVRLARELAERTWSAVESARAQSQLREADRRKDEFLAMLAHELRNPLAPISAAAGLLKIGRLDEARVRHSSAIIGRQVKHMTSLVDDLLDVSRVTRGLVTLANAPVTVRTIVDEAVEQVRPLVEARRQQLALELDDESVTVLGDKARLVQVLANLLGNAAKYSPEQRTVRVRAQRRGEQLALSVIDEGIGMEPALTSRVFDLFAQAERSSDRSLGGLGLGLALVKHLVELHGGTVSCSSPGPGLGSTFVVTLDVMQAQAPAHAMADSAGVLAGEQLRLMVVDDNIDAAETLGMLLTACGHEVIVENESPRALERARRERLDACLLDIGLPEIDGNELARRLRARPETAGIVLIAVTGYGQDSDRQQAFDAGFRHHLVKPVDMEKLAGVLAEIKRGSALVQAA